MFRSNHNKGFQMVFSNGYEVSVQFGPGNYGSNRYASNDTNIMGTYTADLAEICVFKGDKACTDLFVEHVDQHGKGYVTTDEVAAIIAKVVNHA